MSRTTDKCVASLLAAAAASLGLEVCGDGPARGAVVAREDATPREGGRGGGGGGRSGRGCAGDRSGEPITRHVLVIVSLFRAREKDERCPCRRRRDGELRPEDKRGRDERERGAAP